MAYTLGIDLGTTFTAAAVARDGRVEIAALGNHAATIPSLVFLRDNDDVLVGDAAERRGLQEPWRLARGFKRRFGDATPILLDRTPFSAERLMAVVLRQVLDDVRTREGGEPTAVCLAHPANWGPFKTDLLRQAVQLGGLGDALYLTEPVAAALHYASTERVDVGDIVAVYDLGGGTFDAAVLRKTPDGFETLGQPQGIERLGGVDFDEAVFAHVRAELGDALDELPQDDPATRAALARLRHECTLAKEGLSSDTEVFVPVLLPQLQTQVTITRAQFESMIRPTLRDTVSTMRTAVQQAGVELDQVKTILLAGGSSRIPMIRDMLSAELRRPVSADAHPKHAVALGAARYAATHAVSPLAALPPTPGAPPTGRVGAPPPPPPAAPATPSPVDTAGATPPPAAGDPPTIATGAAPTGNTRRWLAAGSIAAALAIVGVALLVTRGGGDGSGAATATEPAVTADLTTAATTIATTVAPPTSSTAAPTTTTEPITCGASGRCVGISSLVLEGDRLVVEYTAQGFDPLVGSTASDFHVHFFYDTVGVENGGVPGPGQWALWDRPRGGGLLRFDQFTTANARDFGGVGATQLCIAVADFRHAIEQDTAFCTPLGFTMPG